jgi:ribonuclease H / adenosylcobalamin/alpha-ribazole phosphatase
LKKLILVRHGTHAEVGHVLSGRSEIPLSVQGQAEADALAEALDGLAIASIHSSPRRRTQETAAPLAARRDLAVQLAPALDEVDFGAFSGRSFAALDPDPDWQRWNAERATARCPGGETMGEAVARALAYLHAIPEAQSPAVCVTHCDVIRGVVAAALGLGLDRLFQFDCDPASWTVLGLEAGGGTHLLSLNERVRRSARA